MSGERGPSTRAVRAGLPPARQGEPFLPGPVLASAFHLSGAKDSAPYGYHRDGNPTWTNYEQALGELEGGEAVVFASGMAGVAAVVLPGLKAGDVLVAPSDAYPGIRKIATEHLGPRGVEVRLVPTDDAAIRAALPGATLVWIETPSNPGLDVLDIEALAGAVHAGGGVLAVDNTLASPLYQQPLARGADISFCSGSKHLSGHSDLVLGHVATRDPQRAAALRAWRSATGAIPGPFEVWLAHRSLATVAVRLERQVATATALATLLAERDDLTGVRYPGVGTIVCFTLADAAAADAFLGRLELVTEATSFGGVHSSAERRGRWGTDAVPAGLVRFSCGIEDAEDLLADVVQALDGNARPRG